MPKINDIGMWRAEVLLAEDFREEEFGCYSRSKVTKAGENIEYFERGFSEGFIDPEDDTTTTLNLFHSLLKNVLPSLSFNRPRVTVLPKKRTEAVSAPFAQEIINHFYKEIDAEKANKKAVWDAYNLGLGVTKVGYATKFGMDVPDEKKKTVSRVDKVLQDIGLKKKPKEEEDIFPEINKEIIAESPYIQWISPFNFLIDPRASSLDDARWVAHVVTKTVDEIKANPMFKNTSKLEGVEADLPRNVRKPIPETQIDAFKTVQLYEIHYRQPDGFYILYITKDSNEFREHYHEKSIYELNDWQFDLLEFSGHTHKLYKRSETTKIKPLQDRFTSTIDAILEQVDSFVPKIAADETALSDEGKNSLENGDIGAVIYTNKNPSEVIREVGLTQLKADLQALNNEIINMVTIQTGITRSQLLGVASGETATAETIAQGGQTLRLGEMTREVERFYNAQAQKLWRVITQFVELEDLEIITGESGVDPQTGLPIFTWLPAISEELSEEMKDGEFRFDIEVGSTQRIDTNVVRKNIENFVNILARPDVIALIQQQGKKVDVAEIIKMWLRQHPETFRDISKIIQDVNTNTQGLLPPDQVQNLLGGAQGGFTEGSQNNALQALRGSAPPNNPEILQEAGQV